MVLLKNVYGFNNLNWYSIISKWYHYSICIFVIFLEKTRFNRNNVVTVVVKKMLLRYIFLISLEIESFWLSWSYTDRKFWVIGWISMVLRSGNWFKAKFYSKYQSCCIEVSLIYLFHLKYVASSKCKNLTLHCGENVHFN